MLNPKQFSDLKFYHVKTRIQCQFLQWKGCAPPHWTCPLQTPKPVQDKLSFPKLLYSENSKIYFWYLYMRGVLIYQLYIKDARRGTSALIALKYSSKRSAEEQESPHFQHNIKTIVNITEKNCYMCSISITISITSTSSSTLPW